MSEIIFTKLTGAGNDFVLIDRGLNSCLKITPELIKNLCDRRFGIGGDGLLSIKDSSDVDFEMEYYNADGSTGMLCGNGARCIIKYAEDSNRIKKSFAKFKFQSDLYSGEVVNKDEIKFNLNAPRDIKNNLEINILDKLFSASFIDTGAHHVIIDLNDQKQIEDELRDLEKFPVEKFGRAIRYSDQFSPTGTNVNFIIEDHGMIKIRTYERGVEQETLACGTGSVGAAIISSLRNKMRTPIRVKTKSGEILKVDFTNSGTQTIKNVSLTGPAEIIFEGKIKI